MINGICDTVNDVCIMATHMPYRKKLCLTVTKGNVETKYATFNNDEAAAEFMKLLVEFVRAKQKEVSE